jgi:hypothetical protein
VLTVGHGTIVTVTVGHGGGVHEGEVPGMTTVPGVMLSVGRGRGVRGGVRDGSGSAVASGWLTVAVDDGSGCGVADAAGKAVLGWVGRKTRVGVVVRTIRGAGGVGTTFKRAASARARAAAARSCSTVSGSAASKASRLS